MNFKKNIIYVANFGIFDNIQLYKFGVASNIYQIELDSTKINYIYESDYNFIILSVFKKELKNRNIYRKIMVDNIPQNNLFEINNQYDLENIISILDKIARDIDIPSLKYIQFCKSENTRLNQELEDLKIKFMDLILINNNNNNLQISNNNNNPIYNSLEYISDYIKNINFGLYFDIGREFLKTNMDFNYFYLFANRKFNLIYNYKKQIPVDNTKLKITELEDFLMVDYDIQNNNNQDNYPENNNQDNTENNPENNQDNYPENNPDNNQDNSENNPDNNQDNPEYNPENNNQDNPENNNQDNQDNPENYNSSQPLNNITSGLINMYYLVH